MPILAAVKLHACGARPLVVSALPNARAPAIRAKLRTSLIGESRRTDQSSVNRTLPAIALEAGHVATMAAIRAIDSLAWAQIVHVLTPGATLRAQRFLSLRR